MFAAKNNYIKVAYGLIGGLSNINGLARNLAFY